MAISKELFLALLSMDAYNRGYAPGVAGLSDDLGTRLGPATISKRLQDVSGTFRDESKAAGFYAIAYTVPNGAVDGITSGQGILGAADSRSA